MARVLRWVTVVILLCDVAVVGVRRFGPDPVVRVIEVPPTTRTEVVLPPGQSQITGTATALAVDAEVAEPVALPFTVEAPRAALHAVVVDGRPASVVWNGGRPLRLEGDGAGLDPSPAHVDLAPGSIVVALDGTPRPLLPGAYRTTAPVAIGRGGLAVPRDGVAFSADGATTLEAAGSVRVGARPLRLDGPGRVTATGRFTVRSADGTRTVSTFTFGPGSFRLDVEPTADGWTLRTTVQGALTTA